MDNTVKRTATRESVEDIITRHIGIDHTLECNVNKFGRLVDINILYMDGESIPAVRQWIIQHIPMIWHLSIDRCYSNSVLRRYHLSEESEKDIEYAQNRLFNVNLA